MIAETRLILIVALGAAWSSDVHAQPSPLPRNALRAELVGCYALFTTPAGGGAEKLLYNASPSVRLDAQPVEYGTPGVVRAMIPLTPASFPMPRRPRPRSPVWFADSLTDTVRLSFVDGYSGGVFVLAAPAGRVDTLTGRRFEQWDAGPMETTHGPARAIRQPCRAAR